MYRNSYQHGLLTVFYSVGSKPLANWDTYYKNGYISRFLDQDIKSMVLEIGGTNVSTTYMICPKGNRTLGISMPFLIMIVKNLKKYFSFEVTILDETGTRRRFRVSNFQSSTQVLPLCTVMPIGLSEGWNQIQFNLAEFTRRAYKKQFIEVQKLKINANIRLRRIYFTERLISEDELPPEYKLYFPLAQRNKEKKVDKVNNMKDNLIASRSQLKVQEPLIEQKTSLKDIKNLSQPVIHSTHKSASRITEKFSDKIDSKLGLQKSSSKVMEKDVATTGSFTKVYSKESNVQSEKEPSVNIVEVEADNLHEPITDDGTTVVTEETIKDDQVAVEVTEKILNTEASIKKNQVSSELVNEEGTRKSKSEEKAINEETDL